VVVGLVAGLAFAATRSSSAPTTIAGVRLVAR
jgi:hypothetical protein